MSRRWGGSGGISGQICSSGRMRGLHWRRVPARCAQPAPPSLEHPACCAPTVPPRQWKNLGGASIASHPTSPEIRSIHTCRGGWGIGESKSRAPRSWGSDKENAAPRVHPSAFAAKGVRRRQRVKVNRIRSKDATSQGFRASAAPPLGGRWFRECSQVSVTHSCPQCYPLLCTPPARRCACVSVSHRTRP